MILPRWRVVVCAVAIHVVSTAPFHAAWPSAILIYGDSLARPVVLGPSVLANSDRHLFLYGQSTARFQRDLGNRPFLKIAILWGGEVWRLWESDPAALARLTPDDATQHGRLYPPAGTAPAVVIATPYMAGQPCTRDFQERVERGSVQRGAIPPDAQNFPCGWVLSADHLDVLRDLRVPGF